MMDRIETPARVEGAQSCHLMKLYFGDENCCVHMSRDNWASYPPKGDSVFGYYRVLQMSFKLSTYVSSRKIVKYV